MTQPELVWSQSDNSIALTVAGVPYFSDTRDHWSNGVLRLLGLTEAGGTAWVENVALHAFAQHGHPLWEVSLEDAVATIAGASTETFPPSPNPLTLRNGALRSMGATTLVADTVWASAIGTESRWGVIGDSTELHGWLVDARSLEPAEEDSALYQEEYFEGAEERVGYGDYLDQSAWRLEKAHRQMRQVRGLLDCFGGEGLRGGSLLDVGSGYGFFRKAAGDLGWIHAGVELSAHARDVTTRLFGFETRYSALRDVPRGAEFSVVTMWDFLEHVSDPIDVLERARGLLAPHGALFVRTPNLVAIERDVFGPHYHSLKREHLHYFSGRSLARVLRHAGFEAAFVQTEAHLLRGLLGEHATTAARLFRGSDIFAMGRVGE